MQQLVQLQKDIQKLQDVDLQLVGVSYDSVAVLSAFAKKRNITYPLLSDSDSKVIDAFGVRNRAAGGRQDGIPHPITFVIDRQGVIRAKLPGTVRRRHPTAALVKEGQALGGQ